MSQTIRAFVAIKVAPIASEVLVATRKRLMVALQPRVLEGIRWENAGYHVTLRFLGEITRADVRQLLSAGPITPRPLQTRFQLSLGPLGVFPAAGLPVVVWAGVGGDLEGLRLAQWRVGERVKELGYPQPDFPFHPHITLGRLPHEWVDDDADRTRAIIEVLRPPEPVEWTVGGISLMRSTLAADGGVVYQEMANGPLREPKGSA